DLVEGDAAVQKLLGEPTPGAFPESPGIDPQCVERDHERAKSTELRLGLRMKLFGKPEVAVETAGCERFCKQLPTGRRGELGGVGRQGSSVQGLVHEAPSAQSPRRGSLAAREVDSVADAAPARRARRLVYRPIVS